MSWWRQDRWWSETVLATHMTCDPSFKLYSANVGTVAGREQDITLGWIEPISCMPGYELVLRKQGCMLQVIRRKLT